MVRILYASESVETVHELLHEAKSVLSASVGLMACRIGALRFLSLGIRGIIR